MVLNKESMQEMEKNLDSQLDSQLWHACAGGMVQMPNVNSKVFYFPQGQAEHAHGNVDFGLSPSRVPPLILCRVAAVKYMADPESDEVYSKIKLVPVRNNEPDYEDDGVANNGIGNGSEEKPASFAKTLTQSDANNGGGFSVPRYCAETIFPRLDYSADPPVQTVLAKDVHGEIWKFRHIYRGTPRRHLLTTGWSTFVNHKKLIAGDSIVFLRTENGDLCVGIRRAKRGIGGGQESLSGWNPAAGNCASPYAGFSVFLREDDKRNGNGGNLKSGPRGKERVRPESVIEAATLAANGQPFEIVYYPRASTPEFCVKASLVSTAMRVPWCGGMRFKMAFETEDSSRISWFMGTISSAQVVDPVRWPGSPWRLLQVTWDEPDLLQNVKRVSPWLVELVSSMPAIHLSPFSPPRKKLRLPPHPDFPLEGQFTLPSFSTNPLGSSSPLCCISDNTSAGIQGARHTQFGTSLSDLHFNKLQSGLHPSFFQSLDHAPPLTRTQNGLTMNKADSSEDVSWLTIGNSSPSSKKACEAITPQFVLFGQPILTEQQMSLSFSSETVSQVVNGNSSSPEKTLSSVSFSPMVNQCPRQENPSSEGFPFLKDRQMIDMGLETGQCKVFMESEDVGRTLDLSVLNSYEELYRKLADMFLIEPPETLNHVVYLNMTGAVKHAGDEPFSEFKNSAKRLTVLADAGSDNQGKRKWMTGARNAESGIDTSNKTGQLSIFA